MASSFTQEDIRLLEKTISIRERVLDKLIENGNISTSAKDVEALTGLADSMDRSIFTKAKISIDEANSKVNEETKEVLRDLLLDLHKNNAVPTASANQPAKEAPSFEPRGLEVKEGELIPKHDQTDVNQFLESRQT